MLRSLLLVGLVLLASALPSVGQEASRDTTEAERHVREAHRYIREAELRMEHGNALLAKLNDAHRAEEIRLWRPVWVRYQSLFDSAMSIVDKENLKKLRPEWKMLLQEEHVYYNRVDSLRGVFDAIRAAGDDPVVLAELSAEPGTLLEKVNNRRHELLEQINQLIMTAQSLIARYPDLVTHMTDSLPGEILSFHERNISWLRAYRDQHQLEIAGTSAEESITEQIACSEKVHEPNRLPLLTRIKRENLLPFVLLYSDSVEVDRAELWIFLNNANKQRRSKEEVVEKIEQQVAQFVVDYWKQRLAAYRLRVDQTLSAPELLYLNRLRERMNTCVRESGPHVFYDDSDDPREIDSEAVTVRAETMEIASHNRVGLDLIKESFLNDLASFIGEYEELNRRLEEENAAMRTDREMLAKMDRDEGESHQEPRPWRESLNEGYPLVLEPIIMLLHPDDLPLLLRFGQIISSTPEDDAGEQQREVGAMLLQNNPNPTTGSTTIVYHLGETSTATTLTVYNSAGAEVASYNEGSRPAGEHQITVDVSELPAGAYNYRLSVQTDEGSKVYSKVMQVVR